jgi:hypothetical protein
VTVWESRLLYVFVFLSLLLDVLERSRVSLMLREGKVKTRSIGKKKELEQLGPADRLLLDDQIEFTVFPGGGGKIGHCNPLPSSGTISEASLSNQT